MTQLEHGVRPMLAAQKFDAAKVAGHLARDGFLWIQPKIDGMRVMVSDALLPLSRSGKEHKSKPLRAWLQRHPSLRFLDGEVVSGHIYSEDSFRQSMSGVRAADGSREFTFYAFDYYDNLYGYNERLDLVKGIVEKFGEFQEGDEYHARLLVCPTFKVTSMEELDEYEQRFLVEGWEGAILRRDRVAYKHGRSTINDGALIKMKRFEDAEAIVTGYEPWEHNANEATESPLGYTARSSHQDGKVALERLGAWHVELATDRSVKFKIGVLKGVTHSDRDRLWTDRDAYIGRICKFKHQGYAGGYSVPRTPVFLNWRSAAEF